MQRRARILGAALLALIVIAAVYVSTMNRRPGRTGEETGGGATQPSVPGGVGGGGGVEEGQGNATQPQTPPANTSETGSQGGGSDTSGQGGASSNATNTGGNTGNTGGTGGDSSGNESGGIDYGPFPPPPSGDNNTGSPPSPGNNGSSTQPASMIVEIDLPSSIGREYVERLESIGGIRLGYPSWMLGMWPSLPYNWSLGTEEFLDALQRYYGVEYMGLGKTITIEWHAGLITPMSPLLKPLNADFSEDRVSVTLNMSSSPARSYAYLAYALILDGHEELAWTANYTRIDRYRLLLAGREIPGCISDASKKYLLGFSQQAGLDALEAWVNKLNSTGMVEGYWMTRPREPGGPYVAVYKDGESYIVESDVSGSPRNRTFSGQGIGFGELVSILLPEPGARLNASAEALDALYEALSLTAPARGDYWVLQLYWAVVFGDPELSPGWLAYVLNTCGAVLNSSDTEYYAVFWPLSNPAVLETPLLEYPGGPVADGCLTYRVIPVVFRRGANPFYAGLHMLLRPLMLSDPDRATMFLRDAGFYVDPDAAFNETAIYIAAIQAASAIERGGGGGSDVVVVETSMGRIEIQINYGFNPAILQEYYLAITSWAVHGGVLPPLNHTAALIDTGDPFMCVIAAKLASALGMEGAVEAAKALASQGFLPSCPGISLETVEYIVEGKSYTILDWYKSVVEERLSLITPQWLAGIEEEAARSILIILGEP